MTALRQQFLELLHSRGLSRHTQTTYVRAVRQLAAYYHRSPDRLSDEQVHAYLQQLCAEKRLSESSITLLICGLKLFYTQLLHRRWQPFSLRHGHSVAPRPSPFPAELRQRFIEDLQLQGLSARTQQAYARAVRQLAEYCQKSPAEISEEDLRRYFLHVNM